MLSSIFTQKFLDDLSSFRLQTETGVSRNLLCPALQSPASIGVISLIIPASFASGKKRSDFSCLSLIEKSAVSSSNTHDDLLSRGFLSFSITILSPFSFVTASVSLISSLFINFPLRKHSDCRIHLSDLLAALSYDKINRYRIHLSVRFTAIYHIDHPIYRALRHDLQILPYCRKCRLHET